MHLQSKPMARSTKPPTHPRNAPRSKSESPSNSCRRTPSTKMSSLRLTPIWMFVVREWRERRTSPKCQSSTRKQSPLNVPKWVVPPRTNPNPQARRKLQPGTTIKQTPSTGLTLQLSIKVSIATIQWTQNLKSVPVNTPLFKDIISTIWWGRTTRDRRLISITNQALPKVTIHSQLKKYLRLSALGLALTSITRRRISRSQTSFRGNLTSF